MSECYNVYLKINVKDESKAIDALQSFIKEEKDARFYEEELKPQTLKDWLKLIFCGYRLDWDDVCSTGGFTEYASSFNASYGWFYIMVDAFYALQECLEDGSKLTIYPDHGVDIYEVICGKVVYNEKESKL